MSEGVIVAKCLEWLAQHRIFAWRQNTGATKIDGRWIRYGHPGCSDILGVLPPHGAFLAIEVKTATGRQRKEQKLFQTMIERSGGVYLLVRTVDELASSMKRLGVSQNGISSNIHASQPLA